SADIRHRPPFVRNAPPLIRNLAVADGTQANPERSPVIRLRTFSPHADRALTGCPAKVHSSGQKGQDFPIPHRALPVPPGTCRGRLAAAFGANFDRAWPAQCPVPLGDGEGLALRSGGAVIMGNKRKPKLCSCAG